MARRARLTGVRPGPDHSRARLDSGGLPLKVRPGPGLAIAWARLTSKAYRSPMAPSTSWRRCSARCSARRLDSVVGELFRVAAPGGLVAMANHGPGGFLTAFAELMSRYSRSAPVGLPSAFALERSR